MSLIRLLKSYDQSRDRNITITLFLNTNFVKHVAIDKNVY